jgi:hypothetical protein
VNRLLPSCCDAPLFQLAAFPRDREREEEVEVEDELQVGTGRRDNGLQKPQLVERVVVLIA